ncbi:hypothetical protein DFJ73DRAFT_263414 [Zopfochytrium polystomum]|nr:hypothetical protein DFJ73DRAFT_263414 [Zopfochytrium polystomum]
MLLRQRRIQPSLLRPKSRPITTSPKSPESAPFARSLFTRLSHPFNNRVSVDHLPIPPFENAILLHKKMSSSSSPPFENRLAKEKSPYLLQHKHNPVNWYPWGEEAFNEARTKNKPILLSVGYSTCHWCHVMEKESFEKEEIAEIQNEYFVSIKVDREERPTVDRM